MQIAHRGGLTVAQVEAEYLLRRRTESVCRAGCFKNSMETEISGADQRCMPGQRIY